MYGTENYIELFDTVSLNMRFSEGMSGIAFSADKIGDLGRLGESLNKVYDIRFGGREREFNGEIILWFSSLHIIDSTFFANTRFGFWIMEYKKQYFDHMDYSYTDNLLTKEAYLNDKEPYRSNKIVRRFSGVVMKLSKFEQEYLSKFFDNICYQKIQKMFI